MNLPTTKPNDRDLDWYVRECEWLDDRNRVLERENAALRSTLTLIRSTTDESGLTQAQIIETVGNYCDEVLGVEART